MSKSLAPALESLSDLAKAGLPVNAPLQFNTRRGRIGRHSRGCVPMRKFTNRPEDVVEEMMQGLALLHPSSAHLLGHKVMIRSDAEGVRRTLRW